MTTVLERLVMCELCDADERTEEQAESDNWKYTYEGWICESCYDELQEPHAEPASGLSTVARVGEEDEQDAQADALH